MSAETLEARVATLEATVAKIEQKLTDSPSASTKQKKGWRWFVGVFENSPDFDEVVRIGEEWRSKDRPTDEPVQRVEQ